MKTDIRLVISREELSMLVADTVVNRLKSIRPLSQSEAEKLTLELMRTIAPQIRESVVLHVVNGVVLT